MPRRARAIDKLNFLGTGGGESGPSFGNARGGVSNRLFEPEAGPVIDATFVIGGVEHIMRRIGASASIDSRRHSVV